MFTLDWLSAGGTMLLIAGLATVAYGFFRCSGDVDPLRLEPLVVGVGVGRASLRTWEEV